MLKKFRDNIDALDKKILKLLNQRADIAKNVAEYKKSSNNTLIFRPERESQIIKKLRALNKGPLDSNHIHYIYREIISACLSLETNLNVSFLGPEGTYSQIAARKFFGNSVSSDSKNNLSEVFDSVRNNTSDYGVVPVENSNQGSIKATIEFLLKYDVKICGEQNMPIRHTLMSKSKSYEKIKKIYAHSQTLSQCSNWINNNMPNAECISTDSNAKAALLANKLKNSACIANEICSKLYKLKINASNINDSHDNTTRFLIIGNSEIAESKNDKTTFVMTLENKSGSLSKVLQILSENRISMTKIESIPTKEKNWEYLFLIDITGHKYNNKISNALNKIEKISRYYQLLGSYPKSID